MITVQSGRASRRRGRRIALPTAGLVAAPGSAVSLFAAALFALPKTSSYTPEGRRRR